MRINSKDGRTIGDLVEAVYALLNGDFILKLEEDTAGSSATTINAGGYTKTVRCKLVNSDNKVLKQYNGALPISVTATTAGDGTATLEDTKVAFVNGYANITITYDGTYATDDTVVLTIGNSSSIGGVVVEDVEFTDTIVE